VVADFDFTSDERRVLGALMAAEHNTSVSERAVPRIALRTGLRGARRRDATKAGWHRARRRPPRCDAKTGEEFWMALNEAAERLDPPPTD